MEGTLFMKYRLLSLLTIAFISFILVGCNNNAVNFEINFDTNGGSIIENVIYDGSNAITIPNNPTKEGFVFDGWFWDNGTFEVPFTANSLLDTPIEDDLTVYAKWVEQDDELTAQLKSIYLLAVQINAFQGTYEEWLETVRGPQGVPGEDGLSAYQIYLIHYPSYNKTEAEWLNDLINDKLGDIEEYTVNFNPNGGILEGSTSISVSNMGFYNYQFLKEQDINL